MTSTEARRRRGSHESGALLGTLSGYWRAIFPVARAELSRWSERARAIPDPILRHHALRTLADEHMNAEGAAIFATLAPPSHRTTTTRLLVRYQVLYDYLDTLTEQPVDAPLVASRHLHRALTAALGATPPSVGYYAHHPHTDDAGYLDELVSACRTAFEALPAARSVRATALRAARRSAEGQSQNHAAMLTHSSELMRWATATTPPESGLLWWETAAAAGSSLAIHALIAAAADPATGRDVARRIEAAYWPWVNGINTLLESMIDRSDDMATDNHSYVSHYDDPLHMAARFDAIVGRAADATRELPRGDQHAAILTGMAAFYLSSRQARGAVARPAAERVRRRLGPALRIPLWSLRVRRRLQGERSG